MTAPKTPAKTPAKTTTARTTPPKPPAPPKPDLSYLTEQQINWLIQSVEPYRVGRTEGRSNMMAYDIRNHLNEVFGFGRWSADTLAMELIYDHRDQTSAGKPAFNVAYRAQVQLKVHAPDGTLLATYSEWAAGEWKMPEAKHGDCHDAAMKTAESQALKRCAINLGNQFGLSLYAKGSLQGITRGTFVHPATPTTELEPITEQRPEDVDPDTGLPERDINQEPTPPQQTEPAQAPQTAQAQPEAPAPTPEPATAQQQAPAPAQNVIYDGTEPVPLEVDLPALIHEFEESVALLPEQNKAALRTAWKKAGAPPLSQFKTKQQIDKAWGIYEEIKPAPMAQPGQEQPGPAVDAAAQQLRQQQQAAARRHFPEDVPADNYEPNPYDS